MGCDQRPEGSGVWSRVRSSIHIGRNVWVGGGAIILPDVTIDDDAMIAAGSTAYGTPAQVWSDRRR
jgi:acetyltransferase-like isoleucine patch superfamily enzyme